MTVLRLEFERDEEKKTVEVNDHVLIIRYKAEVITDLVKCSNDILLVKLDKSIRLIDITNKHREFKKISLNQIYTNLGMHYEEQRLVKDVIIQ